MINLGRSHWRDFLRGWWSRLRGPRTAPAFDDCATLCRGRVGQARSARGGDSRLEAARQKAALDEGGRGAAQVAVDPGALAADEFLIVRCADGYELRINRRELRFILTCCGFVGRLAEDAVAFGIANYAAARPERQRQGHTDARTTGFAAGAGNQRSERVCDSGGQQLPDCGDGRDDRARGVFAPDVDRLAVCLRKRDALQGRSTKDSGASENGRGMVTSECGAFGPAAVHGPDHYPLRLGVEGSRQAAGGDGGGKDGGNGEDRGETSGSSEGENG